MFRLKPTRMTVSDLRPSLSYRLGVDAGSRASLHWVELALATDPELFSSEGASRRTRVNFVTFRQRFAIPGSDAIVHVPPWALLALAGGSRIYAGAALFRTRQDETPLAVIRPDAQSIYVAADGFTGSGISQRFGFAGRPEITGAAPASEGDGSFRWSGDLPEPGRLPALAEAENFTPYSQSGPPLQGARTQTEGPLEMDQTQGFMHKSVHYQNQVPPQPAQTNGNGQATAPVVDYDDGYGTPPAPMPAPQKGQGQGANGQNGSVSNGSGNGNGQQPAAGHPAIPVQAGPGAAQPQPVPVVPVAPQQQPQAMPAQPGYQHQQPQTAPTMPGNQQPQAMPVQPGYQQQQLQPAAVMPGYQPQPQPMPPSGASPQPQQPPQQMAPAQPAPQYGMAPNGMPQNGAPQPQPATQQGYVEPLEYVLPVFDSYWPLDVIRTLSNAWSRYRSFTAGVGNTTSFPFSSIVCLRVRRRRKSDGADHGFIGTGFYIGPNLLLTNAHNFAENNSYQQAHSATVYAGLNSQAGPGHIPSNSDAVSVETVDPGTAVTIHPLYFSADGGVSKAHDLAVVRVQNAVPHGQFFRIANFSPSADSKIAVCGYGAGSHQQHDSDFDWQDLLPEARADYRQHLDADVIREVVNNGEGIHYNLQTLGGNSGSPVFLAPENVQGEDPTALMQVIAVHSSGATNTRNHGVLLTPNKRDWALSGGTMAVQQSYSKPMVLPPAWVPIAAEIAGTVANVGIAALQSGSGDLTWSLQKMDGWLPAGGHPTPTITVDRSTLHTQRNVEINSPVWHGTVRGDLYAHFYLDFQYDGTGVGGITIEPQPYSSADNAGGGMRIDMQITPLLETFPSHIQGGAPVACVEVKMMYTYEWTISDSDQVTVIYRLFGDGTYDSSVRGGAARLDATDTTFAPQRR